ncbi:unnamed protein product [Linum trigynum]|uniref:Uncharacterized protein n=1 Tax=Linum trigynum TaxID=586398 RepID=A0AAV2CHV4_9ROSI
MGFELHSGEYVRAYNHYVVHGGDGDDDDDEPRDEPMAQPQSSTPLVTLEHIWERMDDMYDYMRQMTTQMSTLQVSATEMRDEFRSFSRRYMHPTTSDYYHARTTNEENADE